MTKNVAAAAAVGFVAGLTVGVLLIRRPVGAGASLAGFLAVMVLVLLGTGAALMLAPGWLKRQKRRGQLEEAERLGQVYAAMSEERPTRPGARRAQSGPAIYIVGGAQAEQPGARMEEVARLLGVGQ